VDQGNAEAPRKSLSAQTSILHPTPKGGPPPEGRLHRESLEDLPRSTKTSPAISAGVYVLLVHEWLDHMKYLKKNSPYLFSLAKKTTPFDRNAYVVLEFRCNRKLKITGLQTSNDFL